MCVCYASTEMDPDVERAQTLWAEQDVDQVFHRVFSSLDHLQKVLKKNTATDREKVQGLKLLEVLDLCPTVSLHETGVLKVIIGSGDVMQKECLQHSPPPASALNSPSSSRLPPAVKDDLLPPLVHVELQYHPHTCSKMCVPSLPSKAQATPSFWGENPLKVPLLLGFKRLSAMPLRSPNKQAEFDVSEEMEDVDEDYGDVVYKAPCGQSLRNHDDVWYFLCVTESLDILQVDLFTFNPSVQVDPLAVARPQRPEIDLSRGAEPMPVDLCLGNDGARPPDFCYRRERWPHGCFLSHKLTLFNTCCDCKDGCNSAESCTCRATYAGGRTYTHLRLTEPQPSGLYECGPWCGCDRDICQNRVVQRGIRIRLQVFQTKGRGWGVRCRDDVDHGTFVCAYAGLVLQRMPMALELPPPKLTRCDLQSDDEVEVVTEWLAPPILEGRSNLPETPTPRSSSSSPSLHVPVIQRPAPPSGDQERHGTPVEVNGNEGQVEQSLKQVEAEEDIYIVDASREGNVSRFINHSCRPNLFVQNVFTDSHDPAFPTIAFFTSSALKAGTELTWNYFTHSQTQALPKQEITCLCGSDGCQGQFSMAENLLDLCEIKGHVTALSQ